MNQQEIPFYKSLKETLSLWFGDRFATRNRGGNVRLKMKDDGNIPITLQLIFAPDRPVRPKLKSIQKSEREWKGLLHAITHKEGQKPAQKWISHIYVNEYILSISDIHFSFLAKEASEHVQQIKDYDLQENGELTLKNEIHRKDGPITFERAESLMNYEGTPEYMELVSPLMPPKTSQNEGHKGANVPGQQTDMTPKEYPHDPEVFKTFFQFKTEGNAIHIVSDLEGELHQFEKGHWEKSPNQDKFLNFLYANLKGKTTSYHIDWNQASQLLASTPKNTQEDWNKLRKHIISALTLKWNNGEKVTGRELKAMAQDLKITDLGLMYELAELAWVIHYRYLLLMEGDFQAKFRRVVDFYTNTQPTFSYTDSNKKLFQQYSTAAPIALLAGWYCDADRASSVFEPSAGNGLLTILSDYEKTVVNEIDHTRLANLNYQPFRKVLSMDASQGFPNFHKSFEVVLSNPPFGNLPERNTDFGGYIIKKLDHVMVAHALDTMKDQGKAALIIGGHTHFNEKGMIQSHRTFFNWLYHNYHVADIINIDSRELYRKQGTAFPLRLILIGGRKKYPTGFAPLASEEMRIPVASFDELHHRVERAKGKQFEQVTAPITLMHKQLKVILKLS